MAVERNAVGLLLDELAQKREERTQAEKTLTSRADAFRRADRAVEDARRAEAAIERRIEQLSKALTALNINPETGKHINS